MRPNQRITEEAEAVDEVGAAGEAVVVVAGAVAGVAMAATGRA